MLWKETLADSVIVFIDTRTIVHVIFFCRVKAESLG
jgi:hypothetical protein